MNAVGDKMHMVSVGPRLGRTNSKEQYVFYYDMRFVQLLGAPSTYPHVDDVFEREPFAARFAAGGFDFVLVNIHVKPDDADAEIRALGDVVAWAEAEFQDPDVIVLGDLNADCTYFDEADRQAAVGMNWITPDDFDTTVKGTVCTYDNFLVADSLMDEFTGEIELFRFDTEYGLDQAAAEDVSDHYPVFAVFANGQ
jgi:endonuclease/exonuclease/phosphatase family metal-dependent hydrolase